LTESSAGVGSENCKAAIENQTGGIMIRTLLNLLAVLAIPFHIATANAQDYPAKTIRIVIPFPAGGSTDFLARLLAERLQESTGQSVLVDNRPGGNYIIAAESVAKAPPDGYTLFLAVDAAMSINQLLYSKLSYSPEKDFEPVINIASTPNVLVINPKINANNIRELVALSKSSPGTLTFASAGNGSTSHLCGESLKRYSGIDMTHIPYQGPAPAIQDVLGGQVSMICDNFSNVIQYIRAGRLKALFVASKERHPQASDIPSSSDVGLPDVEAGIWYGIVAPSGTPKSVVALLNVELSKALRDSAVKTRLESLGLKIIADKPQEFNAQISKDSIRFQKDVKLSGISIE
jgi:tripartite-type tricarboxylate transporter receptor subunit TctC